VDGVEGAPLAGVDAQPGDDLVVDQVGVLL